MHQKSKPALRHQSGFTLVELVIVIVVMAILGGISVSFIRNSILAYVNSEAYYQLADRADFSLRRMSRDIRNALPNSVWVSAAGDYVQFVPIKAGGRYQQDSLDFTASSGDTFTVLGEAVNVDSGDQLVIYNLGISGANAYEGDNIRTLTSSGSNLNTLVYTGNAFPLPSPGSSFYVVNGASFYVCDTANRRLLMYSGYAITSGHPASFSNMTPSIVAEDVTSCSFTYTEGVMQHSGVVTAQLQLSRNGGVVSLINLINVVNSP
jgi:MSHA biogenesis protein MshO